MLTKLVTLLSFLRSLHLEGSEPDDIGNLAVGESVCAALRVSRAQEIFWLSGSWRKGDCSFCPSSRYARKQSLDWNIPCMGWNIEETYNHFVSSCGFHKKDLECKNNINFLARR